MTAVDEHFSASVLPVPKIAAPSLIQASWNSENEQIFFLFFHFVFLFNQEVKLYPLSC